MRRKIVAGNWKMNNNLRESIALVAGLQEGLKDVDLKDTRVIVAPAFVNLYAVQKQIANSAIELAAQNAHNEPKGAYTGEVSMNMLAGIDIKTVILGHSERRLYFGEDNAVLTKKVRAALENEMEIIFCIGETLEHRKNKIHFQVVNSQIENVLFDLPAAAWDKIILAYEPVWAIGTGETATASQAQEMHKEIRNCIGKKYDTALADNVSILYGGSCKPNNAREIFQQKDVDGGLIGGASLNPKDFVAIIKAL